MNTKKLLVAILSSTFLAVSASDKNPVVMTVNGRDVHSSEFKYLYKKNKQQQIEEQSFDKYVDMFVTYKLKVADALANGIDTTQSFIREYNMYRNDLAQSYLEDKSVKERLAVEQYGRMKEDVDIYHLMISLEDGTSVSKSMQMAKLDSLRTLILNGASFEEIASKHSIDPSVRHNKGHIGWVRAGMFPYKFEYEAWNTPVGEISPVFSTDFGYHIVKPIAHRKARGEVLVEHILLLNPRDRNPNGIAETKAKIDSIYLLLRNGENFEELAKKYSEDPGTKMKGGKLPWFGAGQMVPQFEAVSYDTPIDSISEPFATAYGYHIVKKLDARGIKPFEEVKDAIYGMVNSDERSRAPRNERITQIKNDCGFKMSSGKDEIFNVIKICGGLDSIAISILAKSETPLFGYADKTVAVKDFIPAIESMKGLSAVASEAYVNATLDDFVDTKIVEYELSRLETTDVDFANLSNEYRDGLLLFAISDRNVWSRSNNDAEGLQKFFEENKSKYKWEAPRFKGYLVQAANDSIAQAVKTLLPTLGGDTIVETIRKEFSGQLRVDKIVIQKGKNSMIDACAFGGDKAKVKADKRFPVYFVYDWRIIDSPEVASDDKGAVIIDYQNKLESDWITEMKAKYPVVINKKELKKLRKEK